VPRKKVVYRPHKKPVATRPADQTRIPAPERGTAIHPTALTGQPSIQQGDRVRITTGLYAGELATVESFAGGVIPAAVVRTDDGRTRRARTVDLIRES
jgi:hypothetical protein